MGYLKKISATILLNINDSVNDSVNDDLMCLKSPHTKDAFICHALFYEQSKHLVNYIY